MPPLLTRLLYLLRRRRRSPFEAAFGLWARHDDGLRYHQRLQFADHKEKLVDLLARVVTDSVRTVAITEAMRKTAR